MNPPAIPSHPPVLVKGTGVIGTATPEQIKQIQIWRKARGLK